MAFRLGDRLANRFAATEENDVIVALDGDDEIETGGGVDIVLAGTGADVITIGSGTNFLFGGQDTDADIFRFKMDASGVTTIFGFQDGLDKIDVSAMGITGMSQLVSLDQDMGTAILMGDVNLLLLGATGPLDASDFIFAPKDMRTLTFDINQASIERVGSFPNYTDISSDAPVKQITSLLAWDNFNFVEVNEAGAPYFTKSGDNAIFNVDGADASFSALDPTAINAAIDRLIDALPEEYDVGIDVNLDTDFDFVSFHAGSLATEGLVLTVTGMDDGEVRGSQVFELDAGAMSDEAFMLNPEYFSSVDQVVFSAEVPQGSQATDTTFLVDDIVIADDLVELYNAIPSLPDALVDLL